jgi:beta-lactamase regulating signal transducer with metallopeptidase domain
MDTILRIGLSNALLATGLAVLVAGIGCLSRRPALLHGLWLLVLLKLITPPLLGVPIPGLLDSSEPASEATAISLISDPPLQAPDPVDDLEEALPPASPVEAATVTSTYLPAEANHWAGVLGLLWLGSALAWWGLVGWRLLRFQHLLRHAEMAPPWAQEQARQLAGALHLRRCPVVWLVPAPISPMLLALGVRPRLLVPAALWQRLNEEQRATVLVHELAHLRRGDPWVRRLELLVLGLYWWHPVAWWARHELQEAEEQCCDAWVVWALPQAAAAYASALVETAAFLSNSRVPLLAVASGIGPVPQLKRRLTMLCKGTTSKALSRLGAWVLLIVGGLVLAFAPTGAQSEAQTQNVTEKVQPPPPVPVQSAHTVGAQNWNQNSCLACHVDPFQQGAHHQGADITRSRTWQNLHKDIIKLMDQVKTQRAELQATENRLNKALSLIATIQEASPQPTRQQAAPPGNKLAPPQSDQRLQELEHKLDNLLREVDSLRKDLKSRPPQQKAPPDPLLIPR